MQKDKLNKKTSRFYGVSFNKKKEMFRTCLVYNKKQLHIGFFKDEIQAAKAYNEKVQELNENSGTSYKLNEIII